MAPPLLRPAIGVTVGLPGVCATSSAGVSREHSAARAGSARKTASVTLKEERQNALSRAMELLEVVPESCTTIAQAAHVRFAPRQDDVCRNYSCAGPVSI